MKDVLIGSKLAKLAREKGFDIHCDWRYVEETAKDYHDDITLINWKDYRVKECINDDREYAYKSIEYLSEVYFDIFDNKDLGYYCSAPTQSLLQKWLGEVHNIIINVVAIPYETHDKVEYHFDIINNFIWLDIDDIKKTDGFMTPEEALEAGLEEALKLI